MRDLDETIAFTRRWHDSCWRVRDLPTALGLDVRYGQMGKGCLGISSKIGTVRAVSLNKIIRHDPLLDTAVLLHEAGHILTPPAPGPQFCTPGWRPDTAEYPAWLSAGLLSVSNAQAIEHVAGCATLEEIASTNGVLPQLVLIGLTLREQALNIGNPEWPPMGYLLMDWLLELRRRLDLVRARATRT